jgi:hypothetical protein
MLMPVSENSKAEVAPGLVAAACAPATPSVTNASATPMVARFLPSLTDIAFLMPITFIFFKLSGAHTLLGDGDTGWHIRTGQWILAHHQVPHADLFSFSRPGAPWFAWEWLWDVIFAVLYSRAGLAAVVIASTLVICLTSAALFRLIRRRCDNGLVAIAVTLLATGGCAVHWLARPHLFTFLFFVLSLHITQRAQEGRTRLLAWLVPLTLLWTQIHGGFFVIFLILACYIGSDLLNALIEPNPPERRGYLSRTIPWLATFAGCAAVTFINPYGWQLHQHVIAYLGDPYLLEHIAEFQGLDFHAPVAVYFEPMMIAALAASVWAIRHRRFAEVFLAIGWMHLSLTVHRNVPLFSIACAPLIAEGAMALLRSARSGGLAGYIDKAAAWFQNASASVDVTDRIERVHLVSAAAFALLTALLLMPKPLDARLISEFDPKIFPAGALPVLTQTATHRIWAQDQWGDYLIYRLYPGTKVFIDGRSDFYGDKFGESYLSTLDVQVGWNKPFDRYGIDTIVVAPTLALSSALKVSRDWKVVYDDHVAVVFRRNGPVPGSFVSDGEGNYRDRAITETNTRDPRITQPGS